MSKQNNSVLPQNTPIEVISKNNEGKVYKKISTIGEVKKIKKKKGWQYSYYQIGYSAYKNAIEIK